MQQIQFNANSNDEIIVAKQAFVEYRVYTRSWFTCSPGNLMYFSQQPCDKVSGIIIPFDRRGNGELIGMTNYTDGT